MTHQARLVLLAFAAAMIAGNAHAGIINPSFETGDLTGWTLNFLDNFVVAEGGTDGGHCLTATVNWTVVPPFPEGGSMPSWHWQCGVGQTFSIPGDATRLTFDVRTCGVAPGGWMIALMHSVTTSNIDAVPNDYVDFFATQKNIVGAGVPVGGGFVRYTLDISGAAGMDNVWLSISATGDAYSVPTEPVEFSVDNFQIIPEPATVALLAAGGLLLVVRRRGGPRRACRVP
jgi:hypothetical protein